MARNYPSPAWWALYAILPLVIGLLFLERLVTLPELGHQLLELAIVCVAVALLGLWTRANAAALEIDVDDERRVPVNPAWALPSDVVQQFHGTARANPAKERLN